MLIHSASQLITIPGGPQRGDALGTLGLIENGAVLIQNGTITEVGSSADLLKRFPDEECLDASNSAVLPGFVDPHTHLVWAGDRAVEFEMRLKGSSYMEIMAAGGGIQSTVNATRAVSHADLLEQTRQRAHEIFAMGTTTAEAKTGYGLEMETELKQFDVLAQLNREGPLEISPTFLGAHAVPAEFRDRADDYLYLLIDEMLPAVKTHWQETHTEVALPFVDVFCENGAFNLAASRRYLEAAKALGFPLKIHADEFENLGGAALAVELGAASADHLVKTAKTDIRALGGSDTVAVSLPLTPFGLAEGEYTPACELIHAGAIFALASDLNPGTAWSGSMPLAMALACRYMGLTPAQALSAATINAAAAINRSEVIGSIEVGKQADLLILDIPDYRHLAYRFGGNLVRTVIKKGNVFPVSHPC